MRPPLDRDTVVWTAWIVCVPAVVVAVGFWSVGLGVYLEDFCITRVERRDWSYSGPTFTGPTTLACTGDRGHVAHAEDARPLVWTLVWAVVVGTAVAAAALVTRRARHASGANR